MKITNVVDAPDEEGMVDVTFDFTDVEWERLDKLARDKNVTMEEYLLQVIKEFTENGEETK